MQPLYPIYCNASYGAPAHLTVHILTTVCHATDGPRVSLANVMPAAKVTGPCVVSVVVLLCAKVSRV